MRVPHPGLGAAETSDVWRAFASRSRAVSTPPAADSADDHVTLSRLHEALSVPGGSRRIDDLRLQVSRGTYLVPALEVGQGLLSENLQSV